MKTNINAILDRLSYVQACYSDPDCIVFEMMKISSDRIDCLFPAEKQFMYSHSECLRDSLSSVFDMVYALGQFPFRGSPFSRINFLQQLLFEADYVSCPESAQRLREVSMVVVVDSE